MRLHHFVNSGNSYKVRLLLAELGRPHDSAVMDRYAKEQQRPGYLAVNPRGQVPALETGRGVLTESGAILFYLAHGTAFLPADPWEQAQVVRWLLYEQEHLANQGVGMAHFWIRVTGEVEAKKDEIAKAQEKARKEFAFLDTHLAGREWFVGASMTVADIAAYGYTHRAPLAEIPLGPYPGVSAWLARVAARPKHIAFDKV